MAWRTTRYSARTRRKILISSQLAGVTDAKLGLQRRVFVDNVDNSDDEGLMRLQKGHIIVRDCDFRRHHGAGARVRTDAVVNAKSGASK